ncbi:hypothetical protein D3C81_08160 [compost metagenome]
MSIKRFGVTLLTVLLLIIAMKGYTVKAYEFVDNKANLVLEETRDKLDRISQNIENDTNFSIYYVMTTDLSKDDFQASIETYIKNLDTDNCVVYFLNYTEDNLQYVLFFTDTTLSVIGDSFARQTRGNFSSDFVNLGLDKALVYSADKVGAAIKSNLESTYTSSTTTVDTSPGNFAKVLKLIIKVAMLVTGLQFAGLGKVFKNKKKKKGVVKEEKVDDTYSSDIDTMVKSENSSEEYINKGDK